jgi:hypothetical protein
MPRGDRVISGTGGSGTPALDALLWLILLRWLFGDARAAPEDRPATDSPKSDRWARDLGDAFRGDPVLAAGHSPPLDRVSLWTDPWLTRLAALLPSSLEPLRRWTEVAAGHSRPGPGAPRQAEIGGGCVAHACNGFFFFFFFCLI